MYLLFIILIGKQDQQLHVICNWSNWNYICALRRWRSDCSEPIVYVCMAPHYGHILLL